MFLEGLEVGREGRGFLLIFQEVIQSLRHFNLLFDDFFDCLLKLCRMCSFKENTCFLRLEHRGECSISHSTMRVEKVAILIKGGF